MTENRNDAGQFEASSDALYGRAAELAENGFKEMPEPKPTEQDDIANPREAADQLVASRADAEPVTPIQYQTGEGERADPDEAVTLDRAARDLANHRASQVDSAAKSISSDFAAELDKMRADAIEAGLDPKETGLDKVSPTAEVPEGTVANEKSGDEPAEPGMEHLDQETRAALKIPQVRQAIEQEFAKAGQVQEAYTAGLENTRVSRPSHAGGGCSPPSRPASSAV
jgi:hypothetical protein